MFSGTENSRLEVDKGDGRGNYLSRLPLLMQEAKGFSRARGDGFSSSASCAYAGKSTLKFKACALFPPCSGEGHMISRSSPRPTQNSDLAVSGGVNWALHTEIPGSARSPSATPATSATSITPATVRYPQPRFSATGDCLAENSVPTLKIFISSGYRLPAVIFSTTSVCYLILLIDSLSPSFPQPIWWQICAVEADFLSSAPRTVLVLIVRTAGDIPNHPSGQAAVNLTHLRPASRILLKPLCVQYAAGARILVFPTDPSAPSTGVRLDLVVPRV